MKLNSTDNVIPFCTKMNCLVLFVVVFMTIDLSEPGQTRQCRHCNNVKGPGDCNHFQNCKEACITYVQEMQGIYSFSYRCGPDPECTDLAHFHVHHNGPVVCHECCYSSGCDHHTCHNYTPAAIKTPAPTTLTTTTTNSTTTLTSLITSTGGVSATTRHAIISKQCDKMAVIGGLAWGSSVSHSGTPTCPDGKHQPSEALIQEYCAAPDMQNWVPGAKVIDDCSRIPAYTAIAAVTSSFGGSTVAGVFVKCEAGGFRAAIQTCGSQMKVYHLSSNTTLSIPSADKFVILDW